MPEADVLPLVPSGRFNMLLCDFIKRFPGEFNQTKTTGALTRKRDAEEELHGDPPLTLRLLPSFMSAKIYFKVIIG